MQEDLFRRDAACTSMPKLNAKACIMKTWFLKKKSIPFLRTSESILGWKKQSYLNAMESMRCVIWLNNPDIAAAPHHSSQDISSRPHLYHSSVTDDPKMVKTLFAPKGNGNERIGGGWSCCCRLELVPVGAANVPVNSGCCCGSVKTFPAGLISITAPAAFLI